MIKKFAILIAVVALSGCATTYTYDGQKYDSKEKFLQAVDSKVSVALSTITPIPTPLTQRKLIFAIPSVVAFTEGDKKNFVKTQGREPSEQQIEVQLNLNQGNFKNIKVFFEAIQKRNIFASTQFIEMDSTTGSFAASPDADALFLVAPAVNSSQWFYTSDKHGKQIFSYDRSSATMEGKLQAFIDAVQAQAVRD